MFGKAVLVGAGEGSGHSWPCRLSRENLSRVSRVPFPSLDPLDREEGLKVH